MCERERERERERDKERQRERERDREGGRESKKYGSVGCDLLLDDLHVKLLLLVALQDLEELLIHLWFRVCGLRVEGRFRPRGQALAQTPVDSRFGFRV